MFEKGINYYNVETLSRINVRLHNLSKSKINNFEKILSKFPNTTIHIYIGKDDINDDDIKELNKIENKINDKLEHPDLRFKRFFIH